MDDLVVAVCLSDNISRTYSIASQKEKENIQH